ncbi:nucleotidyltransferase domain-containing protein [bacterium]|nr:MAG: nucleotidyltransferase domain-containing protein [candidate division KSB1 bacterium]MBC6948793.1 nucleotidyltransferase domain-containing protein [candidate division KSB1 bacterium]MCE7943827.1 nucleotidyltransferase domain-containing protein [Chlorobi bacterium CHB1]MCL4704167.1 nucleotidyltransferase domain-containing protein [bacterium]MDL1874606.1 nucleotidyltransferase domain-containing protein [Cytophagia bacterium CHB2]
MAPDAILNRAKKFVDNARQDGILVEAAYLFGSWAQGSATKWSDIDLAIVSSTFEGTSFYDRRKMYRAVIAVDTAIETHPFRPEDFNESNPFVREILRTGIRIA